MKLFLCQRGCDQEASTEGVETPALKARVKFLPNYLQTK